uniref:56 kDa type-specific antigen n=1 Tax=Orientia tsutsugamushi TaxID=784 RepID=A2TLK3_ORITS|nr:56-kDa type-specific antigen [Orientia tsutsugamushi]
MKKIMLIASAMSALSLPFSASAIELGDEGGLECGPYAKVGVVGGMITGVESARLDPADVEGKKYLSLTTGLPFGGTLAAGMTIAPGFRAEIGVMYLTNVKAEVESGKTNSGTDTRADTDSPILQRPKFTPPQPTIMPISIADRNLGVDVTNVPQNQVQPNQVNDPLVRGGRRIAWLKEYAGIEYMVKDPNNPGNMMVNPVLSNIPQGNPANNPRAALQPCDILNHDHLETNSCKLGVACINQMLISANVSPVKVLSDKIAQIYRDVKPFAKVSGIEVPSDALPNSASVEQIQNKMQELNDILEEIRESYDGCVGGNAFADQIQLNFRIPQVQRTSQQRAKGSNSSKLKLQRKKQQQPAAVRVLNNNEQIIKLYKDLVKLKRHAGIKKAMEKLAAQDGGCDGGGDNKKKRGASEDSDSGGGAKEGKGKETEFDLSMIVGQVKLYADVFTTESFSIYAGLGAGLAYTSGKIDGVDIKGNTGMVASGALGVAVNAAEGVCVDIEGGYMHSFSKIEDKYSVNALMASAGVRYNF